MKRLISILCVCFAFTALGLGQQVDPSWQINWNAPGYSNYVVGTPGFSSIQSAVTAAGSTGSVVIPPSYMGTDTITSNSHNVRIFNNRPFNPTGATLLPTGTAQPNTTIKASEYGAVCDGVRDDTAAIQAAVNALAKVAGGAPTPGTTGSGVVELPQGRCETSSTIVLSNGASLQGSRNGTWLLPLEPWLGTSGDLVDLTVAYVQNGVSAQESNRFVKDINFKYNYNATNHTAIRIFNPAGQTAATPYPVGVQFAQYQIPSVTISGNTFYTLDTAIMVQDCAECFIIDNEIFVVRVGVFDSGNNYGLVMDDDSVIQGSWNNSTVSNHTTTYGTEAALEFRWICNTGCTAPTQTLIASPQGLTVAHSDFSGFDTNLFVYNMQGLEVHDSGFDYGGAGPATIANPTGDYPSILFGPTILSTYVHDNYIASFQGSNGIGLEVQAPTSLASGTPTYNDLDVHDNYFYEYNAGVGNAIQFDAGTFPNRGVKLTNNTFGSWANGIVINHPMQYSLISGNYTFAMGGGADIALNAPGTTSFSGLMLENNTSSSINLVVYDQAGGGYSLGYNQSVGQLLGSVYTSASGCAITAGAVGNNCTVTLSLPTGLGFADNSYSPICSLVGGSGNNTIGPISIISGSSFSLVEIALSTTATGGGTVNCTARHN